MCGIVRKQQDTASLLKIIVRNRNINFCDFLHFVCRRYKFLKAGGERVDGEREESDSGRSKKREGGCQKISAIRKNNGGAWKMKGWLYGKGV